MCNAVQEVPPPSWDPGGTEGQGQWGRRTERAWVLDTVGAAVLVTDRLAVAGAVEEINS